MRYFISILLCTVALANYAQPVPYYSYYSDYSASMRNAQKNLEILADKGRQPNAKSSGSSTISPEAIEKFRKSWAALDSWKKPPAPGTTGGVFTNEQNTEFRETKQKRLNEQYYVNTVLNLYNDPLNTLLPKITTAFSCQSGNCQEGLETTTLDKDIDVSANYKNGKKNGIASFYIKDPLIAQLNAIYENDVLNGKATLEYKDGSYQNMYFNAGTLAGNAILFLENNESINFNRNRGIINGLVTRQSKNDGYSQILYTDGKLFTMLKANTAAGLVYPSPLMYQGKYYLNIEEEEFDKNFDDDGSGAFTTHYKLADGGSCYLHLFYDGTLEMRIYNFRAKSGIVRDATYWSNGDIEEDEIKKGKSTDNSTMLYANGAVFSGDLHSDGKPGKGKMIWPNKDYFIGEYNYKGQKEKGQIFYANGTLFFEGTFKDDLKSGKGKAYYADSGETYEGDWANDMFNGKGKITKKNGYYKTAVFKDFVESNVVYFSIKGAKITESDFNNSN